METQRTAEQKKANRDHYKEMRWQKFDDFSNFVDRVLENDGIFDHMHHIQEEIGRKFEITSIRTVEKNQKAIESARRSDMFPPHNVHRQILVAFKIPHDHYNDSLLTAEDRARFDAFNESVPVDIFFEEESGSGFCKISWGFQNIANVVGDYMGVDISRCYTMDYNDIRPSDHRFNMLRPTRSLANALYKSIKRAAYVATHLCSEYAMRCVTQEKKNSRDDYIRQAIEKVHPHLKDGVYPYVNGSRFQAFKNIEVKVYDRHNEWSEDRTEVELRFDCKAKDLESVLIILKQLSAYNYYPNN